MIPHAIYYTVGVAINDIIWVVFSEWRASCLLILNTSTVCIRLNIYIVSALLGSYSSVFHATAVFLVVNRYYLDVVLSRHMVNIHLGRRFPSSDGCPACLN